MSRKTVLEQTIDRARVAYYYSDKPIMEDPMFDALLKELESVDPTNPRIHAVGIRAPKDTMLQKVPHRVATNSLKKVDTEDDLRRWHTEMGGGPVVVQLKADGASLVLYYVNGVLDQALTRGGDDSIGEDVSANAFKFKGVPVCLPSPFTGGVRGEAILMTEDFLKVDPTGEGNARNIGNGIIRRKTDSSQASLITFLAFNFEDLSGKMELPETEYQKIALLVDNGFIVMETHHCDIDSAISTWHDVDKKRKADELMYKIDGIVFKINDCNIQRQQGFSSGCPKAERVLKFEAPGATTTLDGFVLTMGSNGAIKPTASLKPVTIDNTEVKSAQLSNWDIIAALDIAIGDTIRVIKAKDIIPYVEAVVERAPNRKPIPMPLNCPWCKGAVGRRINTDGSEGADIECKNLECSEKVVQRIEQWIDKHRILYIGETFLRKMVTAFKMQSPADLYRVTEEQLANLIGVGNAARILPQIEKTRRVTLRDFLGALSIPFLGRRRVEIVQEKAPGEFETLADWRGGKLLEFAEQASISSMAPEIKEAIHRLAPVIDDLLQHVEITKYKPVKPISVAGGVLSGKTFVFTGKILRVDGDGKRFTRDMMHEKVRSNGGATDDKIKKSTPESQYVLVQADKDSQSSKTQDAHKKGAMIVSEAEFWGMIGEEMPVLVG